MRAWLLAVVLLAVPLAGCAEPAPSSGPSPSDGATGAAAGPEWGFTDTEGTSHSRDAPSSNATVLFFMATWCSTCISKRAMLSDAHADYAPQGVRFYSLDFDPSETEEQIEAWKERYDQPWPHGIDPDLQIQRTFGVTSQSTVIVLDADGHVVKKWGYGRVQDGELRAALDETLGA